MPKTLFDLVATAIDSEPLDSIALENVSAKYRKASRRSERGIVKKSERTCRRNCSLPCSAWMMSGAIWKRLLRSYTIARGFAMRSVY